MYKVFKQRGEGKTKDLLIRSDETGIPVMVRYHASKRYAEELAMKLGLGTPSIMTLGDNLRGKRTMVYIDDADIILKELFEEKYPGLELAGFSMATNE